MNNVFTVATHNSAHNLFNWRWHEYNYCSTANKVQFWTQWRESYLRGSSRFWGIPLVYKCFHWCFQIHRLLVFMSLIYTTGLSFANKCVVELKTLCVGVNVLMVFRLNGKVMRGCAPTSSKTSFCWTEMYWQMNVRKAVGCIEVEVWPCAEGSGVISCPNGISVYSGENKSQGLTTTTHTCRSA